MSFSRIIRKIVLTGIVGIKLATKYIDKQELKIFADMSSGKLGLELIDQNFLRIKNTESIWLERLDEKVQRTAEQKSVINNNLSQLSEKYAASWECKRCSRGCYLLLMVLGTGSAYLLVVKEKVE